MYRSVAHEKCTVAAVHNLSVQVFPTIGCFDWVVVLFIFLILAFKGVFTMVYNLQLPDIHMGIIQGKK